ncbi:MAG: hypothetical protein CM1200mP41_26750 [Gammaproteobacteria bacterium]|nr:MAG: hypothetical protein CM1200mP41_26750 [Gammaproteobacteria bacterium]
MATALRLIDQADAFVEGFRPGVMERLGLGPDICLPRNPRLVYGRVTGWGQSGPLAQAAGHDINYLGITGALSAIGSETSGPVPPLNMVADFWGRGDDAHNGHFGRFAAGKGNRPRSGGRRRNDRWCSTVDGHRFHPKSQRALERGQLQQPGGRWRVLLYHL